MNNFNGNQGHNMNNHNHGQGFGNQHNQYNYPSNQPYQQPFQPPNQNFFQNPENQQGYNQISQESMHDFYEYKQSKKKIFIMTAIFSVIFIFVLGVITTPFNNGNPVLMSEEFREVLSYSNDMKSKTNDMFAKDLRLYQLGVEIYMGTVTSNLELDTELSYEIKSMQSTVEDLKTQDKAKSVPAGFDGNGGLHHQMIALLELRIDSLSQLRVIAQGQPGGFPQFQESFLQYVHLRDSVLSRYNAKYEANFQKTLYDMKELEFNVQ